MRLSLIIPSFYPATVYGGPIFSSLRTCQELAKINGLEVFVSTTNTNKCKRLDVISNSFLEVEKNLNVKYYHDTVVGKFSISLFLNIWRDIRASDIVHIQAIFNTPVPISLFFARTFNKPTVLTPRGSLGIWVMGNGSRFKKIWLWLFIKPFSNYVVWHVTSRQEKEEVLDLFSNSKVVIIPNGIYTNKSEQDLKINKELYLHKYIGLKDKSIDKIIISMGRLESKKGFDILIRSFKKVVPIYPNSYLLIAGPDEGEELNLRSQIVKMNLENNVFIVGSLGEEEKLCFFANADLFVLPSHNENFGNVYLESLALGTPIVASTETPWEEVEKYDCGRWVRNSTKDTADAMIDMLSKDRELMRVNSLNLASRYSWSTVASQFQDLFKSIKN